MFTDEHQFGVPAGDYQGQDGKARLLRGRLLTVEPSGVDVPFQVIDPHQREAAPQRQPFGGVDAHHQRTGQTGAAGHRHGVQFLQTKVRFFEGLLHDGIHRQDVLARSHFGEDAAVLSVQVHLRCDRAGKQFAAIFHHRGRGFVTGSFDGKDTHGGGW